MDELGTALGFKVWGNGAQPAAVRPHAAFDNEICVRPHIRFGGRAGVY